jgi:catechol 2,3-dioxygenase-like lactoylglutathione lyase family enzyme
MSEKMQIRHIAIRSEDPDQLCSFYEKTLGLRMVRRNPRAGAGVKNEEEYSPQRHRVRRGFERKAEISIRH